ncbi:MAG: hypothetical protein C0629_17070 [Chromatiales bacterium]|nr:MAG: hypothetical protein C0629_17070 [Chromatiales bacterium]
MREPAAKPGIAFTLVFGRRRTPLRQETGRAAPRTVAGGNGGLFRSVSGRLIDTLENARKSLIPPAPVGPRNYSGHACICIFLTYFQ